VTRSVHTENPSSAESPTAFVHVVGQVNSPGLYELPAGSRIVDAVAAAGGFTATADQAQLNLAQVVEDGQQIVVLARGVAPVVTDGASTGATASGGTVDINTADATTLETLDGIGPSLAQRILAYRTAHGGFRTVGDLQNVTGIGPKKFAAIKANVST
jgi:competence protein ComEA